MSNIQRLENSKQIIQRSAQDFKRLAQIHGAVHFEREASFSIHILQENSYLQEVAFSNPDSLRRAVLNVAAVGLTLSPVYKYAYLVPRDKKVCLDISYQGLIKLATDIGSIEWAVAEIVKEKDKFIYRGVDQKPTHEFNPFEDRGSVVGCYCMAKLPGGDYLVSLMPIAQIEGIRNRTKAWQAYQKDNSKTNPWVTDPEEMCKKTAIKRGWKSWPKTEKSNRLAEAIELTNEADAIDVGAIVVADESRREGLLQSLRDGLTSINKEESKFLEYASRVHKRDLKSLVDMTDIEIEQSIAFVNQYIKKDETNDSAK